MSEATKADRPLPVLSSEGLGPGATGPDIAEFQGDYRWLSNFWPAQVRLDGVFYPSIEHAYQAAKTHPSQRAAFRACTAGQAKRLGRTVQMRPDWEQVKVPTMRGLIEEKFSPGSELGARLISTGQRMLTEGNTWGDVFWGVCRGRGRNMLGHLLMERRTFLQGPNVRANLDPTARDAL